MFIKNDSEKSKRYFNGKIGVVKELDKEKIVVQCLPAGLADNDEPDTIEGKTGKYPLCDE